MPASFMHHSLKTTKYVAVGAADHTEQITHYQSSFMNQIQNLIFSIYLPISTLIIINVAHCYLYKYIYTFNRQNTKICDS
jgi:hypothetical protein